MELSDKYIEELKNTKEFIRLLELKKIIDEKYKLLIVSLRTKESYYLESLEKDYLDNKKALNEYMEVKSKLYSKEEVKEYLTLEKKISKIITDDFNDIKKSISNKFNIDKIINI